MRVYLFSKARQTTLQAIGKGASGVAMEAFPLDSLDRTLPAIAKWSVVYIDMASVGPKERAKRIAAIDEHPDILFGIVDLHGDVADPASLFHLGAVDYVGKSGFAGGISAKRLASVLAFARRGRPEMTGGTDDLESDAGWSEIVEGREYSFIFLYVGVDGSEELKRRYGQEELGRAMATFRAFIERCVKPCEGRMWLWNGFGGVVLFPLGDHNGAPVACAFRIQLLRPFYDVEDCPLPNALSFRMALSLGAMVYREKKTGAILSDALNSVFHLGQKFTEPGRFTLTADVLRLAPESLKDFCVPAGTFEGKKIFRVRSPLYPGSQKEGG